MGILSRQLLALNNELVDTKQTLLAQNRELDFINRRLHKLSELKEMLTGMLVHDLKAPLRGISRLAHWLVEDYGDVIDDKGQDMADLLIGRVTRMDNLIEGILHYSRIGRTEEAHEDIDLNVLLSDVLDLFRRAQVGQNSYAHMSQGLVDEVLAGQAHAFAGNDLDPPQHFARRQQDPRRRHGKNRLARCAEVPGSRHVKLMSAVVDDVARALTVRRMIDSGG